ncbi:ligase-associated DNA damage response exonuclease [soil metagenome]
MIEVTPKGLYCPVADVYIDPWKGVPKALITHAHSDHARSGNGLYIAQEHCVPLLKARISQNIVTQSLQYGESISMNGVNISFHPAGHIPGSAQIRLEYRGEVWVVSGDYKVEHDGISIPFEPIKCHAFISESTFGLPVFRWRPQVEIFEEINDWWRKNAEQNICSVVLAYSLGKAQRILQNVDHHIGPVYSHSAVAEMNDIVRSFSPQLPQSEKWSASILASKFRNALIIAPPAVNNTPWINRFKPYSLAVASGWMNLRGSKRWSAADRGFVLSDHADWNGLNEGVKATGAEKVYITHGYTAVYSRWLNSIGIESHELQTLFGGDNAEEMKEVV